MALDASKTVSVAATPDKAWATIGDFCGIATWHPAVAKCEIQEKDGKKFRLLTLGDGGQILEQQVAWDDAAHSYSYTIVESPLPVANYKSTLSVAPNGTGSTIIWVGSFDAKDAPDEKAVETISGIYEGGLTSLGEKLK